MNTASLFEAGVFIHIFKSIKVHSQKKKQILGSRVVILVILQGICFIRYVLPWGTISFWAATVITSLLSVLPFQEVIILTVWGRFTVCLNTVG